MAPDGAGDGRGIDELLAEARRGVTRVAPAELRREVLAGALLVDTRPVEQRRADGEMPGAIVIDRNVLEWRLDPSSRWCIPETGYDRRIIVVCREGYSSSLVAATLRAMGLVHATDLVGGHLAWKELTGEG